MKQEMKSKTVQDKEKNLNKMRKIRILYSDPYATDYSSEEEKEEEEELFLRNDYQLNGSKKIVKEIFIPFMPLAYENKKNAFEDVKLKEVMYQTSTKAAKDINDINGLVKKEDIKDFTSGEKGDCNKEDISIQYMQDELNVASLVSHDLYFLDEMDILLGDDGFCNLLESDEINCGSMWKVEHDNDKGSSILPHIDCDFNDSELSWIDETRNWDWH